MIGWQSYAQGLNSQMAIYMDAKDIRSWKANISGLVPLRAGRHTVLIRRMGS